MTILLVGLILFFAAHTFTMFRDARSAAIMRLGALPYRGLYSLVSLAGFVLIVIGFGDAPRLALWTLPAGFRHLTMALMLPAFILLAAAYLPGHIRARTKNPMLLAVKTWALAHLLVNGNVAALLLFGSFLTYGVLDLIVVSRGGRGSTVAVPRARYDAIAVVGGGVLYGLFVIWLHGALIGVPLLRNTALN